MPRARYQQISLDSTPYYHCISRCVRRAFLCGEDSVSGKSFEHRRGWIEARLLLLAEVFAIDVCAYAIMSNHIHVVLHIDEREAMEWTTKEVLVRWHKLHKGTLFTEQYVSGQDLPDYALQLVEASAEAYRERLMDISWFMRDLNEPIARMANREDQCSGHFWEGRFKSQALLDEAALMACMVYVDLNPVRAGIAETPEASDYTSVKQRVKSAKASEQPKPLLDFIGYDRAESPKGLSFKLSEYLELVDLTGRIVREDKRGSIDINLMPILKRLNISHQNWLTIATKFEQNTHSVVGKKESLQGYKNAQPRSRANQKCCQLLA
ncbi:transposase [Marinomonas sp. THO17]|uniref:transposase n=1 Tax=Marinomonas sp. THO17 TaxID=3149048 RepID=UPI00336BF0C7